MIDQTFNLANLTVRQKQLRLEILRLSYHKKYSHLGSCLTAIDGIDAVYQIKQPHDVFVLSNGHAGVAWYAVLKDQNLISEAEFNAFNIHPDRNPEHGIEVSTGSLGQGLPIAVGMALANSQRTIYCMISDGECAEGSIWESLRFMSDHQLKNLVILLNANGWGAYDRVETSKLIRRISAFDLEVKECDGHNLDQIKNNLQNVTQPSVICLQTINHQLPFLTDQDAHYYVMPESDWITSQELLK